MWNLIPKPILCLAPMAGVSDSSFRLICKQQGADVVYSEMASVSALFHKPQKTLELLRFSEEEKPYIVQLFGKDPEHFARATQIISQGIPVIDYSKDKNCLLNKKLKPTGIDLNFGCPARKVFRHGSGAALMNEPELAKNIIEQVVSNTRLPVSIKVRSEVKGVKIIPFLRKIKVNSLGIKAIMVHGRTYAQGFSGPIDAKAIKDVKKYFNGFVIANGGINDLASAKKLLKETGADGLGIATGSYGNPDLFSGLKKLKKPLATREKSLPVKTRVIKKADLALRQAEYALKLKGEKGIIEMRKHLLWYFKGLPNIKKLKPSLVQVKTIADIRMSIQKITNSVE